ncbi:hypothetical protein AB0I28_37565 [Phytomonospora sp. NPDC050363]|uniref:hypothetical protein n=1 Tax=Phytomonospora sp. NPDC050363 TaxID=3155642 RepID=UPI0033FF6F09
MSMKSAARFGAALTAAGLIALAAPAFADDPDAAFTLQNSHVSVSTDEASAEEGIYWDLDVQGSGVITGTVLTVDASDVDFADIDLGDGGDNECAIAAAVYTCQIGDIDYDGDGGKGYPWFPRLHVTPRAGQTGTGELAMTLSADNAASAEATTTVMVAEDIDLAINERPKLKAGVGEEVTFPITVTNTGERTVYNPSLLVSIGGVAPVGQAPANCVRGVHDYLSVMACEFPVALEPGRTYELSSDFTYRVRPDALTPGISDGWINWGGPTAIVGVEGETGTGPELTLTGAAAAPADAPLQSVFDSDGESGWDYEIINFTGENKADLAAVGATLPDQEGETTLTISFRNDGPAALPMSRSGDASTAVWFTLPKGVEVVSMPEECHAYEPGDFGKDELPGKYACSRFVHIPAGDVLTFDLRVNVTTVDLDERGTVRSALSYYGDPQPKIDRDSSNNTAEILFNGATPGGQGGGLANTGVTAGVVAAAGAALAVAGLVAFRAFRRRGNPAYYGPAED